MKRVYTMPKASIESFMVNNYFAAVCYTLGCDINASNNVEKANGTYYPDSTGYQIIHTSSGCGNSSNQYISISDSGSVTIKELNSELGWLTCKVTSSGGADGIKPDSYVTWETSASTHTWHHQGTAKALFPGHPNRS